MTSSQQETTVPGATRARRSGWRSPRLVLGVLLVAGSVVAGARVVAAADDTVPVWAAAQALPAGAEVAASDVERREVRFPDEETAAAYVSASGPLAPGSRVGRPVAAGELLPRDAVVAAPSEALVEVPLSVASDDLPATVRQGSTVDVWVAPDPAVSGTAARQRAEAVRVLADVEVVSVPGAADTLAPAQTRQVILGLPQSRAEELATALGSWAAGRVVVARVG